MKIYLLVASRLIFMLGFCAQASAQNPSPYPEWTFSAGVPLFPTFMDKVPTWNISAGISYEQISRYPGASRSKPVVGPIVEVRYKDIAFASTAEGLGINFVSTKSYRAGVAITYDLGRNEDADARLAGLGSIHPTAELKLYGEYVFFPVVLRGDVRQAFSGYGGMLMDLNVYMPVYGSKDQTFFVMAGPSITFQDSKAAKAYFGVSPAQSASSGLPVFHASAGVRSESFGINLTQLFGPHWFLNGTFAAEYFANKVAASPIVLKRSDGVASVTLGYNF